MYTFIKWVAGGVGALLVLYAIMMVLVGDIIVAQNHDTFYQEKLQMGLTIAYGVGMCGSVLLTIALALWLLGRTRRRSASTSTQADVLGGQS